jgi:hypothetical protein
VLAELRRAYAGPPLLDFPPRCPEIFLTLEIFSGAAELPDTILANIRQSAACWRQFVPEDGLTLDALRAES